MKFQYYLRLLFVCCVVLFVLFSSSFCVFANEVESIDNSITSMSLDADDTLNGQYNVYYYGSHGTFANDEFSVVDNYLQVTLSSDDLNYSGSVTIRDRNVDNYNPMSHYFRDQYIIYPSGGNKMASAGESISVSLDNIKQSAIGVDKTGKIGRYSYFDASSITKYKLLVQDSDGVYHSVDGDVNFKFDNITGNFTVGADFQNVPFDVYKVNIWVVYKGSQCYANNYGDSSLTATSWNYWVVKRVFSLDDSYLSIKIDDNTAGLLSSIIGFIQSILDGVINIFESIGEFMSSVGNWFSDLFSKLGNWFSDLFSKLGNWFSDLFSKLGNWFSDLFDMITALPSKVWNVFESGLKKLFVPDEEYITAYNDKWDSLLADRFGAIYQSIELITEYVEVFTESSHKGTISMPSTTIDLPDSQSFTFGGYEVDIVPDGFDFLVDAVKMATDIICSFMVLNGLKRRFERLLGDRL